MAAEGDSINATVGSGGPCKTPEELAAKAIAPVKSDFLRSPLARPNSTASQVVVSQTTDSEFSLKEKKSKRQLKKERQEERKAVVHLCPEIARKGSIDSCTYGDGCRFSHDLEAFKSQKPPDLEGDCPFTAAMVPCPYGVACRFSGTHNGECNGDDGGVKNGNSEMNGLKKEIQKLLWKNKMDFPRANASLVHADLPVKDGQSVCTKRRFAADGVSGSVVGASSDTAIEFECDETDSSLKDHRRERKLIDFTNKLYLAPLTTVGNLPFRRVCKMFGADVTCGEMAMCTNLLQGQASEWALLRRHSSEDLFGVQICGAYPDTVARSVELIESECDVDFIDINMGCPIDIVVNKGAGSALLTKPTRMGNIVRAASRTTALPVTIKVRTGYVEGRNRIDSMITDFEKWGAIAVTIHGRSRQQRYNKLADWDYVYKCSRRSLATKSLQVLGNGDILSYTDWNRHRSSCPSLTSMVVARGALIKPWIFTEVKEQRDWDVRSHERLDILRDYVRFGLHHWGSDSKGVETTRYFLLEWLSYLHRYIPVALLDILPQQSNWRAPSYFGRDDLETLMASDSAADWIRISEMLLGKVPIGFTFIPKHKSNAYDTVENG